MKCQLFLFFGVLFALAFAPGLISVHAAGETALDTATIDLSRARAAMHVYTRNKATLRQSVLQPGERKSVWELLQAVPGSKVQPRDRMMPNLWATRQPQTVRAMEMER